MSVALPDYREAGRLLSTYGERLGLEGDDAGAQRALANALAIAKQEGDLALEIMTLISAAWVDLYHLRPQENLEKCLRALKLAERANEPLAGVTAYLHAARVEYNRADLPAAQRYAATFLSLSARTGVPARLAGGLYLNQKLALLAGDWQTARKYLMRSLRETPDNLMMQVSLQTLAEYAVGDFKQGEAFLGRLVELYHAAPPEPNWVHLQVLHTVALVAHMTGTLRDFAVARKAAETMLTSQRVNPLWTWFAHAGLALLAVQENDTRSVQAHYTALKGQRGNFLVMDVDRLLGLLAAAIGEMDQAATYFETALATWRQGRYPEYAWTAYDYAEVLRQRGQPGDHSRVTSLLEEALGISEELGMNPLTKQVLLKQKSLKV